MATQMELEVLARNRVATRTFIKKKQQQDRVFFRLSLNVYTDVDNTERARVRDKKTKEMNFVGKLT